MGLAGDAGPVGPEDAGGGVGVRDPQLLAKVEKGPVGMMTVMPSGPPATGASLAFRFLYSGVAGLFAASVAGRALPAGAFGWLRPR